MNAYSRSRQGSLGESINCFKAYDVRGRVPEELDEAIAYRIARAYAEFVRARKVCIGRDVRHSSRLLAEAVIAGLNDSGVDVYDLGLCGTEEVYFGTFDGQLDGGIMVTASHNPGDYNGLKLVRAKAYPISADNGLKDIRKAAELGEFRDSVNPGRRVAKEDKTRYVRHLLGYVRRDSTPPLKLVVNPGNGCAGPVVDMLAPHLPFEFLRMDFVPDGDFPNGVPNPMLEKNRERTAERVRATGANLGIAWDGDFDRCFFFDESGHFVESYYLVGLLAEHFLALHPGANILLDPRLTWNTIEIVEEHGGHPIVSKSGHAFMKEKMRTQNCVYGGEMSAHHYFQQFGYCDSGMIPWLLVARLVSETGTALSELVESRRRRFPVSGEINRRVEDAAQILKKVQSAYASDSLKTEHVDGLSMEFSHWRFNLRSSNTEPLLRLNVESRGDEQLMKRQTQELLDLMGGSEA